MFENNTCLPGRNPGTQLDTTLPVQDATDIISKYPTLPNKRILTLE